MKNLSSLVQGVEVEVLVDKMFAGDKTDEIAFRGKRRYLNKLERLSMDFLRYHDCDGSFI